MERGKITIEENSYGMLSVNMELYKGTVWMAKHEIAALFRVFIPAITANLKVLFKNGELNKDECVYEHRYTNRQGLICSYYLYNLDAIIALSFRVKSPFCRAFRKWVTERIKGSMPESRQLVFNIGLGNKTVN